MTHGSLFSGIGGFDLAAQKMGWDNLFHCEWNPFGQKVLKYYWPDAELFTDITKSDFTPYANRIDVLTGGFPCQPYSLAGKRLGKEDERHLWPQMLRAIREIRPRWVVGENVFGLINWNGGLVFDEVQADLEAEGYDVQPYVLPASAVNAPHRRDRIWFVAHNNAFRCDLRRPERQGVRGGQSAFNEAYPSGKDAAHAQHQYEQAKVERRGEKRIGERGKIRRESFPVSGSESIANPKGSDFIERLCQKGFTPYTDSIHRRPGTERKDRPQANDHCSGWDQFPTEPPLCGGNDGLPRELDGITFSKWRQESLKAYGNAVVPALVLQIFKAINQYELLTQKP